MSENSEHRAYQLIIRLYPRAHRQEYGGQMLQTFADLMADQADRTDQFKVWLRVIGELPSSLAAEHIQNIQEMKMNKVSKGKKIGFASVIAILAITGATVFVVTRGGDYQPTTLAQVPRSASPPPCLQTAENSKLPISKDQNNFIANVTATSIIDVPAGTNVNVYLRSYDGKQATGSALYDGKYGTYNFKAVKSAGNGDNYTGNWKITSFAACKR